MVTGYSLDALVKEHYKAPYLVLANTQINTLYGNENVGTYPQNMNAYATVANGYPEGAQAGNLEVLLTSAGNTNNCIQRYTNFANLRVWIRSQASGSGDRTWTAWVEQVNMSMVYNAMYPVGIVVQFNKAVNPNNTFPGTAWTQITDGRAVRAATSNVAGTTPGQIGSVQGSDSSTLAVGHLPPHNHAMNHYHNIAAHSHPMPHTHGINAHTHGMNHVHTIQHDHPAVTTSGSGGHSHSVSGSTNTTGNHSHTVGGRYGGDSVGGKQRVQVDGTAQVSSTAGNHSHTVTGTAAAVGNHTHTVDIPFFSGLSGGSLNTAGTGDKHSTDGTALTTNGTNTANTSATALTTGGASVENTANTGSGSAFSVLNASHYYSFWERTA